MSRSSRQANKANKKLARQIKRENRKPLRETKVFKFLEDKAPDLLGGGLEIIGGTLGIGKLEKLGEKIAASNDLNAEDKATAMQLLEMDVVELQEISKRWSADMMSDSWLSKNVRPLVCLYTWVLLTVVFCLKWAGYDLPGEYITLFTTLALAVNGAYFGARTIEKYHKTKYED